MEMQAYEMQAYEMQADGDAGLYGCIPMRCKPVRCRAYRDVGLRKYRPIQMHTYEMQALRRYILMRC
jgi:hypothetical protein